MIAAVLLIAGMFRFTQEQVVRLRRSFFVTLLGAVAALGFLLAVRRSGDGSQGFGVAFSLAMWIVAAPFCRSWVGEDARQGYAAFWLQKPVRPAIFYLTRLVALTGWAAFASMAVCLAVLPGALLSGTPEDVVRLALGGGWIPPLLVVLSFLGSAAGARNSGLFAYGVLFASFTLPGFADALWLGPAYDVLAFLLPPVSAGIGASAMAGNGDVGSAVWSLGPLVLYWVACGAVGVLATGSVPIRLTRQD